MSSGGYSLDRKPVAEQIRSEFIKFVKINSSFGVIETQKAITALDSIVMPNFLKENIENGKIV